METHTTSSSLLCYVFAFVLCCVGLCFLTQLFVRYVFALLLVVFVTSLVLPVRFFSAFDFVFGKEEQKKISFT